MYGCTRSGRGCSTRRASAAEGSAEIIKKADCGFISVRNPIELSEIIKQIIYSHDEIAEMRKNACKFYNQNFRKEIIIVYLENMMSH